MCTYDVHIHKPAQKMDGWIDGWLIAANLNIVVYGNELKLHTTNHKDHISVYFVHILIFHGSSRYVPLSLCCTLSSPLCR